MQEVTDDFRDEGYIDDERSLSGRITFTDSTLFGREDELKKLHTIYEDVCNKQSAEIVLISGYSGTGKSALVTRFVEEIDQRVKEKKTGIKRCFYLDGKFAHYQSEPFSAVIDAFDKFAADVMDDEQSQISDIGEIEDIKRLARKAVGSERSIITEVVPSLTGILGDNNDSNENFNSNRSDDNINNNEGGEVVVERPNVRKPRSRRKSKANSFDPVSLSSSTKNFQRHSGNDHLPREIALTESAHRDSRTYETFRLPRLRRHKSRRYRRSMLRGSDNRSNEFDLSGSHSSGSGYDGGGGGAGGSFDTVSRYGGAIEKKRNVNRLTYNFGNFVRAICTDKRPVIFFLDDIQWADTASLRLVKSLIRDSSFKNILFIGTMRSNEVGDDAHKVNKNFLENIKQDVETRIHRFDLHNLSLEKVNEFVKKTLDDNTEKQDDDDEPEDDGDYEHTMPLTKAIYNKTRGNMFFTRQALEELNRKNIIYYSYISFQWEWNTKDLEKDDCLSDDVGRIVAEKIKSVPELLQRMLMVAAYTRSSFDTETIFFLLESVNGSTEASSGKEMVEFKHEFMKILDLAVLESLLTYDVDGDEYRFSHDRIQEAALSLAPEGKERVDLQTKIGLLLYDRAHTVLGEDWMYFVAADHLNHAYENNNKKSGDNSKTANKNVDGIDDLIEPFKLAKLNSDVGEMSMNMAAFIPAHKYLSMAYRLLKTATGDRYWEESRYYDFALQLIRALSEVEIMLGNLENCEMLCQEVLDNASSSDDTILTYRTLIKKLGAEGDHQGALDMSLKALDILCNFPKGNYYFHAMKESTTVKKLLKKNTNADILALPEMTDEKMLLTSTFLVSASLRAHFTGNKYLTYLCQLKNIHQSFKYGLFAGNVQPFCGYGLFMYGQFNNTAMGKRMSELSKALLDKYDNDKETQANVYYALCSFIDAWDLKPTEILEQYQKSHIAGMKCGNIEFGFRNLRGKIYTSFLFGYPLESVLKAGNDLKQQCIHHQTLYILRSLKETMFLVEHLIGKDRCPTYESSDNEDVSEHHTKSVSIDVRSTERSERSTIDVELYDDVYDLDWKKVGKFGSNQKKKASTAIIQGIMSRLQLAVYFDELEVAEKLANTAAGACELDTQYHTITVRTFFTGLMASGLMHQTKKHKYKTLARKMANKMKDCSGGNNLHRFLLMQADRKSYTFSNGGGRRSTKKLSIAATTNSYEDDVSFSHSYDGEYATVSSAKGSQSHVGKFTLYDEAIAAATAIGCIHDAALGNELAAKYFLRIGSTEEAKIYIKRALNLYQYWGAFKKVETFQEKYGSYLVQKLTASVKMSATVSTEDKVVTAESARDYYHNNNRNENGADALGLSIDTQGPPISDPRYKKSSAEMRLLKSSERVG